MRKRTLWTLLPVFLAVVCLGVMVAVHLTRTPGAVAEIRQGGQLVRTVSLKKDTSFTISSPDGGSNTITVSDGRICVSHATCPDQLCVQQGWAEDSATLIVCLPNQLTIQVKGGEASLDAVVE